MGAADLRQTDDALLWRVQRTGLRKALPQVA